MKISGWGRYPIVETQMAAPRDMDDLRLLAASGFAIARGNGRAYGDSAVGKTATIHMCHFNRLIAFDDRTGQLIAEAGVLLSDIIDVFLPRGWFPYVTPGTKFVTLGGMIAADVHGKNHHNQGSFGNYVDWIDILCADGDVRRCSRSENSDLFEWTIGGMGLTGIIVCVAMRLRPVQSAWIKQRTIAAKNIEHAMDVIEANLDATYSVAWIDCLQKGAASGRSLVMLGEHAEEHDVPFEYRTRPLMPLEKPTLRVPFNFPTWALNKFTVQTFNSLYYRLGSRKPTIGLVDYDSYFYPLDSLLGWNKIYGRRGFAQYQTVIPLTHSPAALTEMLDAIARAGAGSFLAVLKRLGPQESRFSFPMEGYTLALDFPINQRNLALMSALDDITLRYDGRFYLAKDSRVSRSVFGTADPRSQDYTTYRSEIGAGAIYASAQSERLGI